jgi:hypothetical protein
MIAQEKKILASRYSGVLTMLPTPGNAAFITKSGSTWPQISWGERVNEGPSL